MSFLIPYFYLLGSLIFTGYLLVAGKSLVNPLLTAWIVALALKPFAARLERINLPRFASTFITVIISISILFILVAFFSLLIKNIDFELGGLATRLNNTPLRVQTWVNNMFGINPEQQHSILKDSFINVVKNSSALINQTLAFTTNFLASLVFFMITLFFFLYYRTLLIDFLYKTIKSVYHARLTIILKKLQGVISNYVLGLLLIISIVAILNSIGLWVLGVEHAILFGVMASVLTLIPYVGILIGSLLPAVYTLLTTGSIGFAAMVIGVFMGVQFLEGNIITPNIVGRQVSVNPFAAILALIIGGLVLGVTGIMVSLPILAVFKVICDEVSTLQPLGNLIGKTKD